MSFSGVEPLIVGGSILGDACAELSRIFFVVLRAVKSDLLAATRHTHRYHLVGDPIDGVAHKESVGAHTGQHEYMVPEESGARHPFHASVGKEIVGEDAGQHRADDAAQTMGGKDIERVVEKDCSTFSMSRQDCSIS